MVLRAESKIISDSKIEKPKQTTKTIAINMFEEMLWDACIEIISTTGTPISIMTNVGFRKIIKPITTKLNMEHEINVPNTIMKISETARTITHKIREEIKNKMRSVEIKCCFKNITEVFWE